MAPVSTLVSFRILAKILSPDHLAGLIGIAFALSSSIGESCLLAHVAVSSAVAIVQIGALFTPRLDLWGFSWCAPAHFFAALPSCLIECGPTDLAGVTSLTSTSLAVFASADVIIGIWSHLVWKTTASCFCRSTFVSIICGPRPKTVVTVCSTFVSLRKLSFATLRSVHELRKRVHFFFRRGRRLRIFLSENLNVTEDIDIG